MASWWNFTIFFLPEIKDLVLESINYSVVKNRMSNDQRKGVITLVPKKDKDRTNLKRNGGPYLC